MRDDANGWTFGVDTGGTFTDVVARAPDGALHVHKLLSTPGDPSDAIARGARALRPADDPSAWALVHGTTVATNALLERAGARVGLVTTAGFEDVLSLRRQARPDLYALAPALPEPLIARDDTFGVGARVSHTGEVLAPLTDAMVREVVAWARALRLDAVAVCTLHAYADPDHEAQLARALRDALPDAFVTASHELVRLPREYERASTVAVNAYVGPVMSRYLARLRARLPDADPLEVFTSAGARVGAEVVSESPALTVLSGPAGGVVGATAVGAQLGRDRLLTFDMGGTSTDVALCDGAPAIARDASIDGLPLLTPSLDIHTVGAGGGSIAYLDAGGALRVGPRSAGSTPGPAAYGRGGLEPTVTDAHVVLGRLRPDRFLGGDMTLDVDAAHAALSRLAAQMGGVSIDALAAGVLAVADAAMVRALKVISIERGVDPRDLALVSFGGAGGLHACRLADALEVREVVVPAHPGLLSAYGMLHAPRARSFERSRFLTFDASPGCLDASRALAKSLADEAADAMASSRLEIDLFASLRYRGQTFTLELPVGWLDADPPEDPRARFHDRHAELYGWSDPAREVELVGARALATDPDASLPAPTLTASGDGAEPEVASIAFGAGAREDAQVIARASLSEGDTFTGPAVVTEYSGTTVVPPGWRGEVRRAHIVLSKEVAP
jgi:N-methylhydantoinase A